MQLQELEVENGKIRDDLKKLRDALSDEAGEENAQFKEMIGERERTLTAALEARGGLGVLLLISGIVLSERMRKCVGCA